MSGAVDGGHSSTRWVTQELDLKTALPYLHLASRITWIEKEKRWKTHPLLNALGECDKTAFVSDLLARTGLTRFTNQDKLRQDNVATRRLGDAGVQVYCWVGVNFSHITCNKLVLLFTWLFLQLTIYILKDRKFVLPQCSNIVH